jgi:outer membrane protease E
MKSIASLAVFVILVSGLYAEEKKSSYAFSLSVETGILYGTSYEIVYDTSSSQRYLSELQWNIKPLFFAGLSAEFGPRNPLDKFSFFAELEIKAGLPGKTGEIEDRDWLYPVTVPGSLTHFSSHENHTKMAFLADLGGGVSFPLGKIFVLKIALNFSYMFFKYESWNGYIQYGPNRYTPPPDYVPFDSSFTKEPLYGLGMDYTQHWFILSPAVALVVPGKRVSFSFSVAVSPVVACIAFDNHFLRDLLTHERMFGGIFLEPEGNFFFAFSDFFGIGLSGSYRYIDGTRGDRYDTENGIDKPWMRNIAGAGYRAFQGKAVFKFTF